MQADGTVDASQRQALQRQGELGDQLAAVPGVKRQDSRFEGEIALVAEAAALDAVSALVETQLGPAAKPADTPVPKELAMHPLLEAIGGVRPTQTLYLKDLGGGLSLYVAYWPWGGGARFTIKIGVYLRLMPPDLPEE